MKKKNSAVEHKTKEMDRARAIKDYKRSDTIRGDLIDQNYVIMTSPNIGTVAYPTDLLRGIDKNGNEK